MVTKILVWLGFRSKCCKVKTEFKYGWDYRTDAWFCSKCEQKI